MKKLELKGKNSYEKMKELNSFLMEGKFTKVVTNTQVAALICDMADYRLTGGIHSSENDLPCPVGSISGITVYLDTKMTWGDTRMILDDKEEVLVEGGDLMI